MIIYVKRRGWMWSFSPAGLGAGPRAGREASELVHRAAADSVAGRPRVGERESLVRGTHARALDQTLRTEDELALLCVCLPLGQQRLSKARLARVSSRPVWVC